MLHVEALNEALSEQMELRERAVSIESYLENLGVCHDCLLRAACEYIEYYKVAVVAAVLQGETDEPSTALALTSFVAGFALGHVIGSGVATS